MKHLGVRYWILFSLLLAVALLSLAHMVTSQRTEVTIDLEGHIPRLMAGWKGNDIPVSAGTRRQLGTDHVLLRVYEKEDRLPMTLCITFAGASHRATHPAEVCYEGQGWSLSRNRTIHLELKGSDGGSKEVSRFQVSKNKERRLVVVWYLTAGMETASFGELKWRLLRNTLFGGHRWSAMVRLSCSLEGGGETNTLRHHSDFVEGLAPYLDALVGELEGS